MLTRVDRTPGIEHRVLATLLKRPGSHADEGR